MRAPDRESLFLKERPVPKAAASNPEAAGSVAGSVLDPLDLYALRASLSEEERLVQESVARLIDRRRAISTSFSRSPGFNSKRTAIARRAS